jgi:hypothetical protein
MVAGVHGVLALPRAVVAPRIEHAPILLLPMVERSVPVILNKVAIRNAVP